ncbi:ShlB/FhaC/HecB family hemolysin secretion/activation protein [Caballeronia sp. BR00000012568055]|uniref:ShlB/FhaC/HecB family hemolysin secretion/activation protein n=1 Tax=Caballeronia sp. BR00000012568055 TaxID=2918761 RepID=UPI0023F86207|nr:POTRA domain-containing protein [Caballeronia sp. BR00000012568055]
MREALFPLFPVWRTAARVALALGIAPWVSPVAAQTPPGVNLPAIPGGVPRAPDAGTLIQQTQPDTPSGAGSDGVPSAAAPALPASTSASTPGATARNHEHAEAIDRRFTLRHVTISGNDTVSKSDLLPLAAPFIGREVGIDDVEALASRITQSYRDRGYLLAQVIVPPQDVTDGDLRLEVLEGRIGRVRLNLAPGARIRESVVRARLAALRPGEPLDQHALERTMLLLSDLPGVRVSSALEAGETPGTVDLTVNVDAARPWQFALTGDDYGAASAGRVRIGAVARLNSPFMIGDNLDVNLLAAERFDTVYGRVGYDVPVGANGTRVGIAASHLYYYLGKEYAPLDATGYADILTLSATQPLLRSRQKNLLLRGSVEYRHLDDKINLIGQDSRQSLWAANGALTYEGRDALFGGGFSSAEVQLTAANLAINSGEQRMFDEGPYGRHSEGASFRATLFANRLNAITDRLSLFAGVTGQWASRNLDSSSRIALGGPRAVRAYSPSEAVVDNALIATTEVRFAVTPRLTVSAFYDFGIGWYNARHVNGQLDNRVTRGGVGMGAFWSGPYGITANATLAWRTGTKDSTGDDKVPRFYVQLTKAF